MVVGRRVARDRGTRFFVLFVPLELVYLDYTSCCRTLGGSGPQHKELFQNASSRVVGATGSTAPP